jgi:phosphatidylinositol 3-kinase
VQALKFEAINDSPRVTRSTSDHAGLHTQDSGLADFLVGRGVQNPVFGNRLHWYLVVEAENKSTAKMYGRVTQKYMTRLAEVSIYHTDCQA